ncbi:MAG: hypothetical protein B7Y43_03600 [Sphingomonas sp. 28-62-20]|nr:MAG: hypothetical protein B7Y43_03600 [Sphingomonas sp. 28-62-20]
MTREKLDAASQVVKEAATGAIVSDDALQQLSKISGQLAKIIERSDRTRIDWNLIFTILAMIYTIWVGHNSDNDAREALAESRTQTEINRKILEESRAQTALLRELTNETAKKSAVQVKRSALGNRAERRKSAAVERRSKGCRK